jgi:sialic acid synthase SpsE
MFKKFGKPIGISDHTLNIGVSIAAVSLGAVAVEKHFTLSRKIKTPDSFFSMEPQEFKDLVSNIRITEQALGDTCRGLSNDEKKNKVFRRSLFVVRDIKKGELFTKDNIKSIRPGFGLHTRYYADVLGREASYSVKKATPLRKDMVSK